VGDIAMNCTRLHLVIPLAALFFAGCSDPATNEADDALGPATGMPDGTQEPELPGNTPAAPQERWDITAQSFGPFDAGTPYTPEALEAALPGYTLVESQLHMEGMPYPVTLAVPEGASDPTIVVGAIPDTDAIFAVAVREPGKIANPAGRIGQTFAEAGFAGLTCWPGAEGRSGDIVCLDPRSATVGYWLRPEGYDGPDGVLPPQEVLDAATIYEIRWTPAAE
jgi:hypothetical protein